jgi:hypothetical protein
MHTDPTACIQIKLLIHRSKLLYSDLNFLYPILNFMYPNLSFLYPDLSSLYLDLSTLYPNFNFFYLDLSSMYSDLSFLYPDMNFLYPDLSFLLPCGSQQHQADTVTYLKELSPFWRTNSSPWPPGLFKHDLVPLTVVGDSTPIKNLLQAAQTWGWPQKITWFKLMHGRQCKRVALSKN